jgi:phosphatidylinositol alpha-1,6-mannosyltransferase
VNPERPRRELAALTRVPGWRDAVVVSGIWYPEGLLASLGRPRFHAVLAHGMELMPSLSPWRRQLWASLQRRTLTGAQVVVANSRYTAEWVRRTAPDAVIEVVPLAVDAARFTPQGRDAERARRGWQGKQVVLTVSRLAGYKAHDTVLRAIASIPASERSDLCYAIAGRGPSEASLRALAEELDIASSVQWLGFVPESELASLYAASDLFVLVTRELEASREVEGFGLVFLEAQACGTAVVGARTGGIPDAVSEGEGGWLIEAALAMHLRSLVASPEAVRAEGARGRARVLRDCTWSGYWQAFRAALNRHGAGL